MDSSDATSRSRSTSSVSAPAGTTSRVSVEELPQLVGARLGDQSALGGVEVHPHHGAAVLVLRRAQPDVALAGRPGQALDEQRAGHGPLDLAGGHVEGQPDGVRIRRVVVEGRHERHRAPELVQAVQGDVVRDRGKDGLMVMGVPSSEKFSPRWTG